ncbi:hypothetical protein ES703_45641 [subsurface metagenome]
MAQIKKIKLFDLQVNTDNYRFEPLESEEEAVDYMIANQREKLLNTARSILQKGFNPYDPVVVCLSPHQKKKYNVLEGNRRVITLKLLNNPSLIRGHENSSLKKKFKNLSEEFKSKKIIIEVPCSLCKNPKEAEEWIGMKHGYGKTSGVGTESWDPIQKDRFREKTEGKSSVILQVLKKIQGSNYFSKELKGRLRQLKITNLDRLLSDPDVRDFLGMDMEKGVLTSKIEEKEVMKGLAQIISDLLEKDFNVKRIYWKDDRKHYLEKFPKKSIPNKNVKSKKTWNFKETSSSSLKKSSITKLYIKERKKLIPKSCSLKIKKPKLSRIYYELKTMEVFKFTNAVAVLLRVFVELTADSYIEENNLIKTTSSAKSGMDFQQKILMIANHLENKKKADKTICKGIKVAVKDKNNILGIDTWHAYVHNNRFSPEAKNLILTWDNIEDFIKLIWENIK